MASLPCVNLVVNNVPSVGLVDTGCTNTLLPHRMASLMRKEVRREVGEQIKLLDGSNVQCLGRTEVLLNWGGMEVAIVCLVIEDRWFLPEVDIICGMDAIKRVGGINVDIDGCVRINVSNRCLSVTRKDLSNDMSNINTSAPGPVYKEKDSIEPMKIEDDDFLAIFSDNRWQVSWKWSNSEPQLGNRCKEYAVPPKLRQKFDEELQNWIDDGWLVPYDSEKHGVASGNIPLMAIDQPQKNKVRPCMDYRQLNNHIISRPGTNSAVCDEKLREWRKMGRNCSMLDLKKAYLQIFIDQDLQKFQRVNIKGKMYVMTRMGFGLSIAPKVMDAILNKVLSQDEKIASATSNYIDDIIVNNEIVDNNEVIKHLQKYGLQTKEPETLNKGTRVLGLHVFEAEDGSLLWKRDVPVPDSPETDMTRRQVYSLCGKFVGHYPVCGRIRIMCSYIKRLTVDIDWDDKVPQTIAKLVEEVRVLIQKNDTVQGVWSIPTQITAMDVWTDASSIAIGCCLTHNGGVIEDASWLRKKNDTDHINVAELEAAIKGINMALRWNVKSITLYVDSATVNGWLQSVLNNTHRIKTSGLSEMLIKRRLSIFSETVHAYNLNLTVKLVKSHENMADMLTRVPQKWLVQEKQLNKEICVVGVHNDTTDMNVKSVHELCHAGIKKTKYLAEEILKRPVKIEEVQEVVRKCSKCLSIDPAPIRFENGNLQCSKRWFRLAIDVTYFNKKAYLTIIDCNTKYALWYLLAPETSTKIIQILETIFRKFGYPHEILVDNGSNFRSHEFKQFCEVSNIKLLHSCAYRHSGNSIIERNHRTIKAWAERSGGDIMKVIFLYNNMPTENGKIPAQLMFRYKSKLPFEKKKNNAVHRIVNNGNRSRIQAGDYVYVKPPTARCTDTWKIKRVSQVLSNRSVEVEGVPYHISHVRRVPNTRQIGRTYADVVNDKQIKSVEVELQPCQTNQINQVAVTRGRRTIHRPIRYGYDD